MEPLGQRLGALSSAQDMDQLYAVFKGIYDRFASQLLSTGGLVIKAGGGVLAKAGTLAKYVCKGQLLSLAANTDMAALVGTVTNAKFNVFVFFIDEAGAVTSAMGTEGGTLAAVRWPNVQNQKVCVGFVIINPTGTGNFVGNTTPLDDATVVPNAVYVNTVGPFDPAAVAL